MQIVNTTCLDIGMLMHNLIECSDNYTKTPGSREQYCRDKLNGSITDSESFKFKARITARTLNDGNTLLMVKDIEIVVH